MMMIDCISDLHGFYPKLEGGDLLIIAGDLTARHTEKEWHEFASWMHEQSYRKIVFIAGNHDTMIEKWDKEQDESGYEGPVSDSNDRIEYLCDSGTEFEGLKIWGSPHSLWFKGINPHCKAFVGKESDLQKKFDLIPYDIDILITHSPPYGILDEMIDHRTENEINTGSLILRHRLDVIKPKLHVFGHIHEHGGKQILYKHEGPNTICVNASIVNENYEHVNKPIRIDL